MDLKIIGGSVVTAEQTVRADVGIKDGRIIKIASEISEPAGEVIDATGKYLLPGGVDVHTHFDMPFPTPPRSDGILAESVRDGIGVVVTADDFFTGTVAAACGGTTTIIDFAIQEKGKSLQDALAVWQAKAKDKTVIDYGFHLAITDLNDETRKELETLPEEGISSIKVFLAYKDSLMVDDEALFRLLKKSREYGLLVMVHAENGSVIKVLTDEFLEKGQTEPIYHALSHPPEIEEEAVGRVLTMVRLTNAPVYFVHLSYSEAVARLGEARHKSLPAWGETCPQYLTLSMEHYSKPEFEGAKYVMSPPLRGRYNHGLLWKALEQNILSVVSSDHCSFNFKGQKELGRDNFSLIPNGIPGVETRLHLLYSEGVSTKKITFNQLVSIFATEPARLFGLYPAKGEIAINSDADIVIFDTHKKFILKAAKLHHNVDYTPYEGMEIKGMVSKVISRGKVIVQDNTFSGTKGAGQFLKRKPFQHRA